ncbi:MAG: hypothetical protein HYW77_03350 [Parcubacteria group bacterium]|nr:hypothetical protein [Parcubacteria group bacterium]
MKKLSFESVVNEKVFKLSKKLKPYDFINKEIIFQNNILGEIEKKLENKIYFNKININYNSKYINFNTTPGAGFSIDIKAGITVDNIAQFAYPLAQFIEQAKPDYVIACDRGARIIGLAVHMLYGQLYGALPTKDHSIHFKKISKKVSVDVVRESLRPDIERMLAQNESPTILVLDDWVSTGETKDLIEKVLHELSGGRIKLIYGVMRGRRADISGNEQSNEFGDWHDEPDLVGVDYNFNSTTPRKVNSSAATAYRKRMSANIKQFVKGLKSLSDR